MNSARHLTAGAKHGRPVGAKISGNRHTQSHSPYDSATVTVTEGGVFRKLSAERDIHSLRRFVNSFLLQAFWTFHLFWLCLAGYVYP